MIVCIHMISKHLSKKRKAVRYRLLGMSLREIENALKIPRSTLNGWFKDVKISEENKIILKEKWVKALYKAREKAVIWHNNIKQERIIYAQNEAKTFLDKLNYSDNTILELSLAMIYIGEGYKKNYFGIGNSDPKILLFFINSIEKLYNIKRDKLRCDLNLRADQDINNTKKYWSKILNIPLKNFKCASKDMRTVGSKTFDNYHGVCQLRCPSGLSLQRRILFIAKLYCDKVSGL